MRCLIAIATLFLSSTVVLAAGKDDAGRCARGDNAELCRLYSADQAVRQTQPIDLSKLDDPAAVVATRGLISRNGLRTGNDYFKAATLLLHSSQTEDYLLAHILATEGMAVAPKHRRIRLLTALSLDRYLLAVDQPQVFGTQMSGDASELVFRGEVNCRLLDTRVRASFLGEYPEPCRVRGASRIARRDFEAGRSPKAKTD